MRIWDIFLLLGYPAVVCAALSLLALMKGSWRWLRRCRPRAPPPPPLTADRHGFRPDHLLQMNFDQAVTFMQSLETEFPFDQELLVSQTRAMLREHGAQLAIELRERPAAP